MQDRLTVNLIISISLMTLPSVRGSKLWLLLYKNRFSLNKRKGQTNDQILHFTQYIYIEFSTQSTRIHIYSDFCFFAFWPKPSIVSFLVHELFLGLQFWQLWNPMAKSVENSHQSHVSSFSRVFLQFFSQDSAVGIQ